MYLTDLEKQEDQSVHSNSSSYTSVNPRVHFKLYLGLDSDDEDISQLQQTHDQYRSSNKMLPVLGC